MKYLREEYFKIRCSPITGPLFLFVQVVFPAPEHPETTVLTHEYGMSDDSNAVKCFEVYFNVSGQRNHVVLKCLISLVSTVLWILSTLHRMQNFLFLFSFEEKVSRSHVLKSKPLLS